MFAKLHSKAKGFVSSTAGNFAIVTAVSAPAILGMAAVGLDVALLKQQESQLQQAVDAAALATLRARVHDQSAFQLAAFHDLVSLSGSLIIGFATAEGRLSADQAWTVSRLDEIWQAEQWGKDEEAEALAQIKQAAFAHAEHFFRLAA